MKKIIITGSRGLLGTEISSFLRSKNYEIIECDLQLGHDLTDENFVKEFFKNNPADGLINLYALNPHVDKNDESTNLFDITLESLNAYLEVNLLSLFSVCREYARNNKQAPDNFKLVESWFTNNAFYTRFLATPYKTIVQGRFPQTIKKKMIDLSADSGVAHMANKLGVSFGNSVYQMAAMRNGEWVKAMDQESM